MNINWKYLIIGVTSGFIGMIGFMVYLSFKTPTDLVAEDYYEQEIQYQDKINKIANAREANKELTIQDLENFIVIKYPESIHQNEGTLSFFRPSDKSKDKSFKIEPDANYEQRLDKDQFVQGYYKISADWKEGKTHYLIQQELYIQ